MKQMIPAWIDGKLQPVEKLEAHKKGLKHQAVSVFLMSGNQTLIQCRADTKYHTPGLWANAVCTHPYMNEETKTCAHRRLQDELGMSDIELHFRQTVEYRADVGNRLIEHEVVDIFVGHVSMDHPHHLNPEEVSAIRWVSIRSLLNEIEQTPDIFTPWLRIYMHNHLNTILGQI